MIDLSSVVDSRRLSHTAVSEAFLVSVKLLNTSRESEDGFD